jgi:tol-pal system protein YbgF
MERLRADLARVQEDHDRLDRRLTALEVQAADARSARAERSTGAGEREGGDRPPPLRVITLRPAGDAPSAGGAVASGGDDEGGEGARRDPRGFRDGDEGDAPRPHVRIVGSNTAVGEAPFERRGAIAAEAKPAYDAALALVQDKRYDRALEALSGFLVRYPDHPYANNAMYWRGECYFAKGDLARAKEEFEGLLARFPAGAKVPDALLKIGLIEQRIGRDDAARAAFDRLTREFAGSDAAKKIPRSPLRERAERASRAERSKREDMP